jgi:hypothetical protein
MHTSISMNRGIDFIADNLTHVPKQSSLCSFIILRCSNVVREAGVSQLDGTFMRRFEVVHDDCYQLLGMVSVLEVCIHTDPLVRLMDITQPHSNREAGGYTVLQSWSVFLSQLAYARHTCAKEFFVPSTARFQTH